MDLSYTREKYVAAVQALATEPGRIKERLLAAAIAGVGGLFPSKSSGVSPDLVSDIASLERALTSCEPAGKEGAFAASIDAMSEGEASRCAQLILTIDSKLEHAKH